MHKKIKINKIFVTLMTILLILSFCTIVNAEEDIALKIVDNSKVDASGTIGGADALFTLGNKVLTILQFIGGGVAIIATLLLAIRYMYSSPDDKAEIKRKLIPYIIGGVMIFGVTNLIQLAALFVKDLDIG